MSVTGQPQNVVVDGARLAYVEEGSGAAVVFVHGSVNDLRSWSMQLPRFSSRFRSIAYSRRFHWPNASPGDDADYEVERHAADLGAVLDALAPGGAHVIGSSYGAMTALTLAAHRPGAVRSLTLGEPPILPWLERSAEGAAVLEAFLEGAWRPAGAAFGSGDAVTGVRTFIDGVIGPGTFERVPDAARGMMLDNAAALAAETRTPPDRYFTPLAPTDIAGLPMPVLLLQGERSPRMFGLITDVLAAALPAARRVTVAAASHGMHAQNPDAYAGAVLAFLATV